jgi:uncharacterized membrane protein
MRRFFIAYVATLILMVVLDFGWLSLTAKSFYRARLGDILLAQPVLWPAAIFYLLYVFGVVAIIEMPALATGAWLGALPLAALFGCVAYATYDLTNQATLRNWSGIITIADIAWGIILTSVAATAGFLAARRWS